VSHADRAPGGHELAESRAIDPELLDDATEAVLDLLIDLIRANLEEAGAEIGQKRLEPQTFSEPAPGSVPLPPLDDQTPTWERASALVREWGLGQLAERLRALAPL